jgi:hypothetical protein
MNHPGAAPRAIPWRDRRKTRGGISRVPSDPMTDAFDGCVPRPMAMDGIIIHSLFLELERSGGRSTGAPGAAFDRART